MEFLNRLPSLVPPTASEERRREAGERSRSIKIALMGFVWGSDWGDFEAFRLWAESGGRDPAPQGLEAPVTYYRTGQGSVK
jgi:hypothetical protein